MNKKFAFGVDPSKKTTFTPKPVQRAAFGSKETAWGKPKPPQQKIEIPKANWGTNETGRSAFTILPELDINVEYVNEKNKNDTHPTTIETVTIKTKLGEIKNKYCREVLGTEEYDNYIIYTGPVLRYSNETVGDIGLEEHMNKY